jgi:hypothetical protein
MLGSVCLAHAAGLARGGKRDLTWRCAELCLTVCVTPCTQLHLCRALAVFENGSTMECLNIGYNPGIDKRA